MGRLEEKGHSALLQNALKVQDPSELLAMGLICQPVVYFGDVLQGMTTMQHSSHFGLGERLGRA